MNFTFDKGKNTLNEEKHGIKLSEAIKLWEVTHIMVPAREVTGENRWAIIGKLKNKLYVSIFTLRNDSIRLISCHRTDKKLEKIYYEKTKKV